MFAILCSLNHTWVGVRLLVRGEDYEGFLKGQQSECNPIQVLAAHGTVFELDGMAGIRNQGGLADLIELINCLSKHDKALVPVFRLDQLISDEPYWVVAYSRHCGVPLRPS